MPLEIDDDGLEIMTLDEAREWITARLLAKFGDTLNTGSLSFTGQIRDIVGEAFHLCQEALLALYTRLDPNGATGVWQDRIGGLTGSTRRGESYSTVDGTLTFVGLQTVNDGDVIQHDGTGTLWEAIGGPYTDTDADVPATFQALTAGPVEAVAGSTWSVVTNPTGKTFTNPTEDATPGQLEESAPDYRRRQAIEKYGQGQGPTSAISGRVSKVNTANGRVDTVRTYHNPNQQPTDADGLPWKQTHVIVETTPNPPTAGLDQDIFGALWAASGGGCTYYGSRAGTVTDSEGQSQDVAYDIVTDVDLYIVVSIDTANSLDVDGPVFPKEPVDFATIVFDAVYARAQELRIVGRDPRELDYAGVVNSLVAEGQITGVGAVAVQLSQTGLGGPYDAGFSSIERYEKIEVDTVNIRIIVDGLTVIG